ncbi:MAG TPA: polyhydroxyalkanoate synthesis regulator DNA-binding domain-containing protein [Steroidobacteraceae bacterium]|nr:polyhydroxyalkanoate synthesis regulator DNA-binding domain-containing protein [Steroidobacteraceae bacterium]
MSNPRLIKKYPNRRLYDTGSRHYITLTDIRKLVLDNVDFVVIDNASRTDISSSTLLQVLLDGEDTGEGIISRDFLLQAIRAQKDKDANHARVESVADEQEPAHATVG